MGYYRHDRAIVESEAIGDGTRIWEFAHVLPGATVGADCNICGHTFIENDVVIGDRVTVKCGVQLWDGATIEDDVFIGPNATFTNDRMPRSKCHPPKFLPTVVRRGAVVTHNVPANAIVVGNPARIIGYSGATVAPESSVFVARAEADCAPSIVAGVTLRRLPLVEDLRGYLSFGEVARHIPFEIKRYFLVFRVASQEIRGEHAHRRLHQFLICVHGRCHVVADDGENRQEFVLDSPTLGIHLPPMVWGAQYKYSQDAVLLVFASDVYDSADYIRDYSEFVKLHK